MTEEKMTPLRQRMIEDMNIRGLGEKTQKAHIRNVKHFAAFLGRSPDTATPEELRSYQLKMTQDGVSVSTYNIRIISLRFFFGVTCGHEEMKRFMQFHRKPRKLPIVLSVEEVADVLAAVPGPGLKYRAALGISYGAGLRASEVCHLKVTDIDSGRMLIHVDEGKGGRDRKAQHPLRRVRPRLHRARTAPQALPALLGYLPVVPSYLPSISMVCLPEPGSQVNAQLSGREIDTKSKAAPKKYGLITRLNSHASGRLSGDQFCVYVANRFVIPSLKAEELPLFESGKLTLDARTKTFIHDHLDYAFALVETSAAAYELERAARRGDVFGVQPYLNPL